jgi:hypothetical protein
MMLIARLRETVFIACSPFPTFIGTLLMVKAHLFIKTLANFRSSS